MRAVALWGPVVALMALIFAASSLSDPGAPPGGLSDKTVHGLVYAALGASLLRALAGGRSAAMTPARIVAAAVLGTLYGVTDEVHQSFVPGRTPEWLDVAADGVGASAGAVLLAVGARALRRLRRNPASFS